MEQKTKQWLKVYIPQALCVFIVLMMLNYSIGLLFTEELNPLEWSKAGQLAFNTCSVLILIATPLITSLIRIEIYGKNK